MSSGVSPTVETMNLGQDRTGQNAAIVAVSLLEKTKEFLEVGEAELLHAALTAGDLNPVALHQQQQFLGLEPDGQVGRERD